MTVVVHRVTKQAARYTPAGGVEKCALCRFFAPQGWCGKVVGPVSPRGWCKYYSREAVQRWSNPGYAGSGGGLPAGATLNLNFMTPGTLDPRITFTRASTGTYFDSTGTMQTAAVNAPRWDYDPVSLQLRGLLLEDQRTNGIRNSTMQGAIPGSPGTLPTNWLLGGSLAVTPQVVGTGTENGVPYIDLRMAGITASGLITLLFESTTAIAAANGQAWSNSLYIRLVAGTLANITSFQLLTNETTAAGAGVRVNFSPLWTAATASLATQRFVYSVTLIGGGTVGAVHPRLQINVTNGVAIDATFRIGAPQMEQGDFPTSYIPTTAAVTRSIDSCLIPPANMSPWFAPPGGSWFAEFDYFDSTPTASRVIARGGAPSGIATVMITTLNLIRQNDPVSTVDAANAASANTIVKAASTWAPGQAKICNSGGPVPTSAALTTGFTAFVANGVAFMTVTTALSTDNTSGHIRRVQYYPRVLSDAEMQQVTM